MKNISKPRIALFLDGPNLLRKEFEIDLNQIKSYLSEYGSLREAKVFLNQFAPDKLIEAVANQGFEPIIGVGEKKDDIASDVDVYVATAAVSAIYSPYIDIIA
ncbi:MAG: NYN domain-containing protein, partial [Candidatus Aenigmarchaeota archaeon]|nr:NYN domain-containing protein [Candidatus Aenigmarchaeota archaeon]